MRSAAIWTKLIKSNAEGGIRNIFALVLERVVELYGLAVFKEKLQLESYSFKPINAKTIGGVRDTNVFAFILRVFIRP